MCQLNSQHLFLIFWFMVLLLDKIIWLSFLSVVAVVDFYSTFTYNDIVSISVRDFQIQEFILSSTECFKSGEDSPPETCLSMQKTCIYLMRFLLLNFIILYKKYITFFMPFLKEKYACFPFIHSHCMILFSCTFLPFIPVVCTVSQYAVL